MVRKSLDIEKNYSKSLFNMGVIQKKLGNNKYAIGFYFRAIEENPLFWESYLNISAIYIEEEEFEKTIEILSRGIDKNPHAHDLYYNRACAYSILGKEQNSISDIKKAIGLFPEIIKHVKADKDFLNLHQFEEFIELIRNNDKKDIE